MISTLFLLLALHIPQIHPLQYIHIETQSVILYTSITALVMNFISLRSPLTPPCSTDAAAAALGPIEQYSC